MIKNAIDAWDTLQDRKVRVFPQGSYANRTNVREDSDVDVCVVCSDTQFNGFNDGLTKEELGLEDAAYDYPDYRTEVMNALCGYFGSASVTECNKHFDIDESSSRVQADVVACFDFRRYHRQADGTILQHAGTALLPQSGLEVVNWPQQNYDNGVWKNSHTGRRFKKIVRILKRLRNEMTECGFSQARQASSFLIECLVWNVPNESFGGTSLGDDTRASLAHIYNNTRASDDCSEWGEINELHYLFRGGTPGTKEQAHAFASAAWDYIGFKD